MNCRYATSLLSDQTGIVILRLDVFHTIFSMKRSPSYFLPKSQPQILNYQILRHLSRTVRENAETAISGRGPGPARKKRYQAYQWGGGGGGRCADTRDEQN